MKEIKQNPLDEKWWKDFAEELKKGLHQHPSKSSPTSGWPSEIACTAKDIGEPNYSFSKEKK